MTDSSYYRALALHHGQLDSSGRPKTEIIDKIVPGMNEVMADESPRIHSPWAKYVKTALYIAVARVIRETKEEGHPLIPRDAPIGYLPGDDVRPGPADKRAFALSVVCPAPVTTDDVVVISWINSSAIDLPSGADPLLIIALNTPEFCVPLTGAWALGSSVRLNSDADRAYANAYLIRNSGNAEPPPSIDPNTVLAGGDFRLFNRFKAQFSVSNGVISNWEATQLNSTIGGTPDPCHFSLIPFPTEAHSSNGANGVTASGTRIYKLTEARVGSAGQAINMTINGRTTPWIWTVIRFETSGQINVLDSSIFPTHYVYTNGHFSQGFPQFPLSTFILKDESYQRFPWEIQ